MGVLANSAYGKSFDSHAAMIMAAPYQWGDYEALHANQFKEAGRKPIWCVDAKGDMLQNAHSASEITTNGAVRHEDWLIIQKRIQEVRRHSLVGITDLMSSGLSFTTDLSDQMAAFEQINEFAAAEQAMNPSGFDNNAISYLPVFSPLPVTHISFSVPWRQQKFDYNRSNGLVESARQVAERLEETLFNGNDKIVVNHDGVLVPLKGYTNHTKTATDSISDWSSLANRDVIVSEFIEQLGLMHNEQGGIPNGSVMVYVSNAIWSILFNDYKLNYSTQSLLERMKKHAAVKDIKPAIKLPLDSSVLFVQMDSSVVELAVASDIIAVPHTKTNPMLPQIFTTYAAMTHLIKYDSNGKTGIRYMHV